MHGWLRPAGTLIVFQPLDEPMALALRRMGKDRPLGAAHHCAEAGADIQAVHRQVVELVGAGAFRVVKETSAALEVHFRSRDDWTEFVERPKTGEISVDFDDLDLALGTVERGEALLVGTEETFFGAYEKEE